MEYSFVLTGNPNVGKTSLFNRLTRSFEHVGNWHGVTVDRVSKSAKFEGDDINIVDLPGFYSLTVHSFEEEISRDEILFGKYDALIYVCAADNLSRNLYLLLQLLELDVPVVVVVNMMDELYAAGKTIDAKKLGDALGVPVVLTSAKRGFDGGEIISAAVAESKKRRQRNLPYLRSLPIRSVYEKNKDGITKSNLKPLYATVKLLERDEFVVRSVGNGHVAETSYVAETVRLRYEFIDSVTENIIIRDGKQSALNKASEALASFADKILLNKFLALPMFLLIMSGIFWITFGTIGSFFTDIIEKGISKAVESTESFLAKTDLPMWIVKLVCYGIIDGVGGVAAFLPQIVILFFFLAILEDSGYISRLAFMTDGLFEKIGLSGRAVFTMIMGFGCSATAVLTARGLDDEMTRNKTVVLTPFLPCSARLPVFTAVAGAFFGKMSVLAILGLYVLGAVVVVASAAIFESGKKLKSGEGSFVMEMPRYRIPTAERVLQILWSNAKTFLIKVGSIVLVLNVIIWILGNFSLTQGFIGAGSGDSILERICTVISPIFAPLGFGNWKAVTALMSGLVAKEVVLSTVNSLGGVTAVFGDSLAAICFLVYTLLYVPCVATLGSIRKEAGTKWMIFGLCLQLGTAYVVTLAFRLTALAFSHGIGYGIAAVSFWTVAALLAAVTKIIFEKRRCVRCDGCKHCG